MSKMTALKISLILIVITAIAITVVKWNVEIKPPAQSTPYIHSK